MPRQTALNKPGVVYGLVDPVTLRVMYVGQTIRTVEERLADHLSKPSLLEDCPKNDWLKGLLGKGLKPSVIILEKASNWELVDAENRWIEVFSHKTKRLTNRFPVKEANNKYSIPKTRIRKLPTTMVSERRLLQEQREKDAVKTCLTKVS
jgi:hypothetical protein